MLIFFHSFLHEEKTTTAKLLRGSLIDCFNEALASDLVKINPADLTKTPKTKIQRVRLSLNDFNTILNLINDDDHWLTHAMKLALITGQRVSDISKMKWKDIHDGKLWIIQQKTGAKIAISLKIEIIGFELSTISKLTKTIQNTSLMMLAKKYQLKKCQGHLQKQKVKPNCHGIECHPLFMKSGAYQPDFTPKKWAVSLHVNC